MSLCHVLQMMLACGIRVHDSIACSRGVEAQTHLGLLAQALEVPGAHFLVDVLLARLPAHHLAAASDFVPLCCRLHEGQDCSLGLEAVQRQLQWTMMLDAGSPHNTTGVAVQLFALLVTDALQQQ
jgi:hypothetical protein